MKNRKKMMKGETGMQTTKILLVEDDRLIIENLTEFLKGGRL